MSCIGTQGRRHVYGETKPEVSEEQRLNFMKRNSRREAQQYDQTPRKRAGTNCMEEILNSADNLAPMK
jgi:molecular chaperone GrpE (heat shock protein)